MLRDLKPRATVDYADGALWMVCGCGHRIVELKLGTRWPDIVKAMTNHKCPEDALRRLTPR